MKVEWVSPVLNDTFLHVMTRAFGGYEDNIRHILVKNIYTLTNILPEQEARDPTSNGSLNRIDLIIPIPQFRRARECVEIKMYNFVRLVPKEIENDMKKLARLSNDILRTFLYFGYYGRFQNPQTDIYFCIDKRKKEINKHCKMFAQVYKNIIGINKFVNRRRIHFKCPNTNYIYYAFWLSF